LVDAFVSELAEKCVGYCGADVRALCTEAALFALRRRYPQIYTTNDKLQLDVSSININARDFHYGMQNIVPTAQRSFVSPGRALSPVIEPLLRSMFATTLDILGRIFPAVLMQLKSLETGKFIIEFGE
jgi:SpoVK/Ycf46/Vps4 family AAA+-type ATPase